MQKELESLQKLFQQEFSKMVAVISKLFGLEYIETAEDIVSETFLQATKTWKHRGIPPNPAAWLYAVARQKTLSHFRRNKIFEKKIMPELQLVQETFHETEELNFSQQNIRDSQLQMIFAVCNPAIAAESQIGLALRILCGFGIDEIAEAFLAKKDTINKRLFRAKEKLRAEKVRMEMPVENEIDGRLDNVLHVIYLLFSEGYYSKSQDPVLRKDLCLEAMRLAIMLTEYEPTNQPKTNALLALMCFHASRFSARQTETRELILYDEQDEDLWDKKLISKGFKYLNLSVDGDEISTYHLEARIAFWHSIKEDTEEKWSDILQLYDKLSLINFSPSVALNRVFAIYKVYGRDVALKEAVQLNFDNNHFYFILLGELYKGIDKQQAKVSFQRACSLAKTDTEKRNIRKKMNLL